MNPSGTSKRNRWYHPGLFVLSASLFQSSGKHCLASGNAYGQLVHGRPVPVQAYCNMVLGVNGVRMVLPREASSKPSGFRMHSTAMGRLVDCICTVAELLQSLFKLTRFDQRTER